MTWMDSFKYWSSGTICHGKDSQIIFCSKRSFPIESEMINDQTPPFLQKEVYYFERWHSQDQSHYDMLGFENERFPSITSDLDWINFHVLSPCYRESRFSSLSRIQTSQDHSREFWGCQVDLSDLIWSFETEMDSWNGFSRTRSRFSSIQFNVGDPWYQNRFEIYLPMSTNNLNQPCPPQTFFEKKSELFQMKKRR
jgi:hypothetical protein